MVATITGWMMSEPKKPFVKKSFKASTLPAGEVLIEVAGCGVCHTDISFSVFGVKTRAEPPLILGHEISGTVVETGEGVESGLKGKAVLVPAVLPCGECGLCKAGHRRICRNQIMPGNDRHGGFATHLAVPAKFLCPVRGEVLDQHELWELAIVSDAVTTPFQAVQLSGLSQGELAICIGVGGIGIHGVQIAAATGAKVIALDVDQRKLEVALESGAQAAINSSGLSLKEIRGRVKDEANKLEAPTALWKIFETSGTKPGQETAFGLMGHGATLAMVGFTLDTVDVRISNLMAFDARMFGNWGCDPTLYPEVLDWLGRGRIRVKPFVEKYPLSEINQVFDAAHHRKLEKRAVLVP